VGVGHVLVAHQSRTRHLWTSSRSWNSFPQGAIDRARSEPYSKVSASYAPTSWSPSMTSGVKKSSMDKLLLQNCVLRSSLEFPNSQREEGNHALRCVPFLSPNLSPSFRARAGGQPPGPLLRSTAPQTP